MITTLPRPTSHKPDTAIYDRCESAVRSYARVMPRQFNRAENVWMHDNQDGRYLDFLSGCSTLNYGHNHPVLKQALLDYIAADGIAHGLDLHTDAKADFLETLEMLILKPRRLDYRAMFTGPTGTNAVEAAIKLARKVTGRELVIAFTNGFHGMTLGALACTGNAAKRGGAGVPLAHVAHEPYDGYHGPEVDTADLLERRLSDPSLDVGSLSRALGVSPRTLHAAVSAGGETFAAMVRRRRLERAAALLADAGSPTTITEIAASVGFDGSSSFSRAFRREFGRAPTDVRRAARGARDGQSVRTD